LASSESARKRPVSASRSVADKRPSVRPRRAASAPAPVLADETPTPNYALRLTEGLDDEAPLASTSRRGLRSAAPAAEDDTFALRLNEALQAISSAQTDKVETAPSPRSSGSWFEALDKLPPIRLPIGPAIPWKLGLPALVAAVVLMGVMSRSAARADAPGVTLPTQPTYAVQQEAPLFARAQPTEVAAPSAQPTEVAAPAAQPLGVQDPGGMGFDFMDIAIKLAAVLGLAYGSLMLLKRVGVGGTAGGLKAGGSSQAMRVVSSLALAPNRSVHVIKVPGGRTLLVGATPNAVNLLADLGELAEDHTPDAASFFDVLKGRVGS